jgi:hypothetical protein
MKQLERTNRMEVGTTISSAGVPGSFSKRILPVSREKRS